MTLFKKTKSILSRLGIAALLLALIPLQASAAQITSRSLTLSTSAISTAATDSFAFTLPTSASIGSIGFVYCTAASGTCTTPTGLSTTSATFSSASGTGMTGFSIVNSTNGSPYITHTAATVSGAVTVVLGNITNPSTVNTSFYVRITSYTSTNATTGATDNGNVGASTAQQVVVTASVPELLTFCVYTAANCASAGAGGSSTVALGTLSTTTTGTGTSLMDVGTNASTGYVITVNGTTLTSGSNTIPAYSAAASPADNASGFGINLRANSYSNGTSTVTVGTDVTTAAAPSNGTYGTGYGTANTFNFTNGATVANSNSLPSNQQTFTVSYIANMGAAQTAGGYTTTLTYICTPTY